jgi:hypothetical protein
MMVRIFKTGTGSAKSAINYLMGKNDHTGKPRSVPPELIQGSPSLFQLVTDSTSRKHKYVSGAISFRDTEHPSEEQIQKTIEIFRASFLPGLKDCDNYADAWIAHRDKGNLELHFLVAGTEKSGRQLNIHPPGKRNIEHFQAFTQVMNQAMGYYQVTPDPLKVALSEFEAKSQAGKQSRRVKTLLAKELHGHIVSGKIVDRDELITHLEDNYGEVTRVGKDYISVRLPGSAKAKRLMGPLFQEGADYPQLVEQHKKAQQPQKLTEEEYTQAKATLEKLTHERAVDFAKRYKKKPTFKRTINRKGSVKGQPGTATKLPVNKPTEPAKAASTPPVPLTLPAEANTATVASTQQKQVDDGARLPTSAPMKQSEDNTAVQFASIPTTSGTAIGMEMQLGSLANLVSKLMVKARTTTNTMYFEVLNAQIVKLQYQMTQLSLSLEVEKARASMDAKQADPKDKPKI